MQNCCCHVQSVNIIQRIIRKFCGKRHILTIKCIGHTPIIYNISRDSYSSVGKKHSLRDDDFSSSDESHLHELRIRKGMKTIDDVVNRMYEVVYGDNLQEKISKKYCHIYHGKDKLSGNELINVLFRNLSKSIKFCYEPEKFNLLQITIYKIIILTKIMNLKREMLFISCEFNDTVFTIIQFIPDNKTFQFEIINVLQKHKIHPPHFPPTNSIQIWTITCLNSLQREYLSHSNIWNNWYFTRRCIWSFKFVFFKETWNNK